MVVSFMRQNQLKIHFHQVFAAFLGGFEEVDACFAFFGVFVKVVFVYGVSGVVYTVL